MEVAADGGGGGPLGDPLAGMQMPPGDPGPLNGVARQLTEWAGSLGTGAADHRNAAASVVGSAWIGPAATRAGKSVATIAEAAATMGNAADHASSAISTCSNRWSEAVQEWKHAQALAKEALADEAAHRASATRALAAMTPGQQTANPAAYAQSQAAADGDDGYTSPQRAQAVQVGQGAIEKATAAIRTAAGQLAGVTGVVNVSASAPSAADDAFADKFLDWDGSVGLPFTGLGAYGQTAAWIARASVLRAFDNHDYSALEKIDPEGYAEVERVLQQDPEDMAAVNRAWFGYLSKITHDADADMARAAVPIDGLDGATGALSKTLDVLGKIGLPIAAAGDVVTLFDPKSSDLDKGLSAANLAGVGMAAAGTDLGGAALGLVGIDTVAAAVPVAGEVVIAGTALYMAGEFVYNNWGTITHWAGDAEHAVGDVAHEGEHLASDALHEGGKLLSDLNPF